MTSKLGMGIALVALLGGACKKPQPQAEPWQMAPAGATKAPPAAPAPKVERLQLVAAYESPMLDELLRTFLAEAPDIEVATTRLEADAIVARGRDGQLGGDVVVGLPRDGLEVLAASQQLAPTAPPACKDIQPENRDPAGRWVGLSLSAVALGVNEAQLREKQKPLPKSWKQLTAETYRGWLVMARPRISRAARILVSSLVTLHHPRGWDLWKRIDRNLFQYTPGEEDPARMVGSGEMIYAIDFEKRFYAERREKKPVFIVYPEPTFYELEGVAHLSTSKSPNASARFLDWLCGSPALRIIDSHRAGVTRPYFENPIPGKLRITQIKPKRPEGVPAPARFFEEWERRFGK